MDEDMPFPAHVTKRGDSYQYVRRIPNELRNAFGMSRIQKSLRTSIRAEAFSAAARLNEEIERQFAEARAKIGISCELRDVGDWTAADWEAVATWFEARLIQDDLERRLPRMRGATLIGDKVPTSSQWSDDAIVKEQIARRRTLERMTIADYASSQLTRVNGVLRQIGVTMLPTSSHAIFFAARCMKAEMTTFDVFSARERGDVVDWQHPDQIEGIWRPRRAPIPLAASPAEILPTLLAPAQVTEPPIDPTVGKTLSDCCEQWKANRIALKKAVRPHYVRDMENSISRFEAFTGVSDIGCITRRHITKFRSHLTETSAYENATINKKVGFLTTLLGAAEQQGWIETAIRGSIFLPIPDEEDNKEPYDDADLCRIFSHQIYSKGILQRSKKSGNELQFWLPLISCLHGLISSEIIQLGPDTVECYPHTKIWCFRVTTSGNRRSKTFARQRYVPIRHELFDLGLLDLVNEAKKTGRKRLWSSVEIDVNSEIDNSENVSGMFSSFWSDFSRKKLLITDQEKTLYSFRHSFQDKLFGIGTEEAVVKQLMGHASSGSTKRYGTKKKPKPIPIDALNHAIQTIDWTFSFDLKPPSASNQVVKKPTRRS